MAYRPPFIDPDAVMVDSPHPATLDREAFMKQCEFRDGRVSGPGGQHRNRNATGTWMLHLPTGIDAKATERRERKINRSMAMNRLRLKLATRVRTAANRDGHTPSELWESRRQGTRMQVNPTHYDYPALLAEAMDLITARRWDIAGAAKVLGISMSQVSRLIRQHPPAFAKLNAGRESVGLPPLRK